MARTPLEIDAFKSAFRQFLGREAEPEAVAAFEAAAVPIEQRVREITYSPEFAGRTQRLATQTFAPQETGIEQSYQEALRNIEQNRQQRTQQLEGFLGQRGLSRSGAAVAGAETIQGAAQRQIGETEKTRASLLSGLASQRTQLASDMMAQGQTSAETFLKLRGLSPEQKITQALTLADIYNQFFTQYMQAGKPPSKGLYDTIVSLIGV